MIMLNPAKLRHRVIIQKPVESQDPLNGAINTVWQDVATVWAEIAPLSVKELIQSQAEQSLVTGRITIRYRADIDRSCRLYHAAKNQYYDIYGILSDKESGLEYITIPVSEGVKYVNAPIDSAPSILDNPIISGIPGVGMTVTGSNGLWANEPDSYEYQWYLNGLPIVGEVSGTLIVPDNEGAIITFGVIAVNSAGDSIESFSDGVIISA